MLKRNQGILSIAAGAVLMSTVMLAQADRQPVDPAQASLDLQAAMALALVDVPGTVVEAELEREKDGKLIWEFEIVSAADGARMELEIDADSGDILSKEADDGRERGRRK